MNYLRELNAFYDWLETNSMSASCIALWHALMAINNRAGWATEFTVAVSTLETKSGLSKTTVERCRNTLKQKGLIDWRQRKGQQSAVYLMKSLVTQFAPHYDAQHASQSASQPDAQLAAITKQDETKQIQEREIARATREITEAYEQTCGVLKGDPGQLMTLIEFVDLGMESRLVIHAIRKSSGADFPAKYADTILQGYQRKGILTLEQLMATESKADGKRSGAGNRGAPPEQKDDRYSKFYELFPNGQQTGGG